jgi:signal transduction histidine kinase
MPNGGRCRIETAARDLGADEAIGLAVRPGRYAILTLRDSGLGIPKDVLPRLFEPFLSTKPGEAGSGLGLATLYAIVSQYGGCVRVMSEPGDTASPSCRPRPASLHLRRRHRTSGLARYGSGGRRSGASRPLGRQARTRGSKCDRRPVTSGRAAGTASSPMK